jgi:hypothetical protein
MALEFQNSALRTQTKPSNRLHRQNSGTFPHENQN